MDKRFIIISGPTGVGKSDAISQLGTLFPIEVVNCDIGSFYKGCTIGTAKPDWKKEIVPHHLFDCIDTPRNFSVAEYRLKILAIMQDIWRRGSIPVLVGGSGFYIKSLFFPPQGTAPEEDFEGGTWEQLKSLDPQRAASIHPHDHYRINRALYILQHSNKKASELKPLYNPPAGRYLFLFFNRDRPELYTRINERVIKMMQQGLIEEVKTLKEKGWGDFLERKKLIGYNDILQLLKKDTITQKDIDKAVELIQKKSRHYAKRQITFWKSFHRALDAHAGHNSHSCIREVNFSRPDGSRMVWKIVEAFLSCC